VWVPDDNLELDHQRLDEAGAEGVTKRRFRVVYEDGLEVSQALEDVWVAQEPVTRVMAYGRKIVTRTLETPEGTLVYWRKVRMAATSYSASTAGKSPDHLSYGRTRLGQPMRKGIVAVDPAVINLGTRVYVPGYGTGAAGDTGSAIQGRRIDLGYDDDNLVLWRSWVDVYLLDPPPPRYQIKWVLPNWPRE
jgi:3D (Asp-Asp-Asp) domain-containing protein